jgi:hypothetical protein
MARLIGFVKIDISSLVFTSGRELDNRIVNKLIRVFHRSKYGCDRVDERNYVPAIITSQDLSQLASRHQSLSRDLELSLSNVDVRPMLQVENEVIQCLHGKHRIKAAEQFLLANDRWWTTKLYVQNDTSRSSDILLFASLYYKAKLQQTSLPKRWENIPMRQHFQMGRFSRESFTTKERESTPW